MALRSRNQNATQPSHRLRDGAVREYLLRCSLCQRSLELLHFFEDGCIIRIFQRGGYLFAHG